MSFKTIYTIHICIYIYMTICFIQKTTTHYNSIQYTTIYIYLYASKPMLDRPRAAHEVVHEMSLGQLEGELVFRVAAPPKGAALGI